MDSGAPSSAQQAVAEPPPQVAAPPAPPWLLATGQLLLLVNSDDVLLEDSVVRVCQVNKHGQVLAAKCSRQPTFDDYSHEVIPCRPGLWNKGLSDKSWERGPWALLKMCGRRSTRQVLDERALKESGALGMRRYARGQWLSVLQEGGWVDAEVVKPSSTGTLHKLRVEKNGKRVKLAMLLHPWNHALRELPHADFEVLREWWMRAKHSEHKFICDALTGRELGTLDQCVAIDVTRHQSHTVRSMGDVRDLSTWLLDEREKCFAPDGVLTPKTVLLTAPPAAGKTTLMSQLMVLAEGLVPILIKVHMHGAHHARPPHAMRVPSSHCGVGTLCATGATAACRPHRVAGGIRVVVELL